MEVDVYKDGGASIKHIIKLGITIKVVEGYISVHSMGCTRMV